MINFNGVIFFICMFSSYHLLIAVLFVQLHTYCLEETGNLITFSLRFLENKFALQMYKQEGKDQ